MNKKIKVIIAVVIVGFFGYMAWSSFSEQMTPYVGFQEARASGKSVQVIGILVDGYSQIDSATGALEFSLQEEESGDLIDVKYLGVKPGNFEQADKIVAIGRYNDGVFNSNQLLVKCPSKYQGNEDEEIGRGDI